MFDLDETLMKLNSTELIKETVEYAKICRDNGLQLVVMSNQYGISKGQTTHEEVQERFEVLRRALGDNVSFLYATDKDQYRKPMTGMFDILCNRSEAGKPVKGSFYCGDAVGRATDFAVSDLYFAWNCGVSCFKPPDGSSIQAQAQVQVQAQDVADKFNLYKALGEIGDWVIDGDHLLQLPEQPAPLLIMMVGPPGSGKSHLSKLMDPDRFKVLNNDTIGRQAVEKEFLRLIRDGEKKSIILDNTNYDQDKRKYYIGLAKAAGYTVRIYYFDIPKALCLHMCHMRVQLGGPRIPPVAIHTYYKRLQPPTEGEIVHIGGIASYTDSPITPQHLPQFYYHYDLKER
jgi:bifunctional polynucleotide phosphatase/kinase